MPLSAALDFATRRARGSAHARDTNVTAADTPPPGTDSCYGVRSLDSSGWDSVDESVRDARDLRSDEDRTTDEAPEPSNTHHAEGADTTHASASASADPPHSASTSRPALDPTPTPQSAAPARTASAGSTASAASGSSSSTSTCTPTPAGERSGSPRADEGTHPGAPTAGQSHETHPGPSHASSMTAVATSAPLVHVGAAPSPSAPTLSPVPTPSVPVSPGVAAATAPGPRTLSLPISRHALLDMLADAPDASEPSSPSAASAASAASMSLSLSSLSRVSSPADWDWRGHPLAHSTVFTSEGEGERTGVEAGSIAGLLEGSLGALGLAASATAPGQPSSSAELVLPTLALPSSSLNLGLERWPGPGQGLRIALVGSAEHSREVLAALVACRACVQLPRGEVGVLAPNGRELAATVVVQSDVGAVRRRATEGYTALHALLHPSPSREKRAELEAIVTAYAASHEWVHLALVIDGKEDAIPNVPTTTLTAEYAKEAERARRTTSEHSAFSELSDVHTSDLPSESEASASEAASPFSARSARSRSASPSTSLHTLHTADVDDTPRWVPETMDEPWRLPSPSSAPGSSAPASIPDIPESDAGHPQGLSRPLTTPAEHTAATLSRLLSDTSLAPASAAAFFTWRPQASPATASPASSTFESGLAGLPPMPTVARAQGGGEWEATLSRRLAHRRELDAATAARRARGVRGANPGRRPTTASYTHAHAHSRRRRSHSPPDPECTSGPLFPRFGRPPAAHLGLGKGRFSIVDAVADVFAPVKALVRSRWTHVVVACAVAIAVGCGLWARVRA